MIVSVTGSPKDGQALRDLLRLRRVRDRIDREYAQPLDVEALARGVHMSAGHLSRQFRRAFGESPYSYLMTRRIERAMALLRRGDLNVTEVCFEVGCSSLGTFSTRFKELVGMSPSDYREREAGATAGMPPCVAKQVTRPVRNRAGTAGAAEGDAVEAEAAQSDAVEADVAHGDAVEADVAHGNAVAAGSVRPAQAKPEPIRNREAPAADPP